MKTIRLQSVVVGSLAFGAGSLVLAQGLPASPSCAIDNTCVRSQNVPARFFPDLKSQRVLAKYGPLSIPTVGKDHLMGNYFLRIPPPCTGCLVTEAVAGVEYTDGKVANANTGMYLHHAVVFNNQSTSASCPQIPEPVFASGNERTVLSISVNGTVKAGYAIEKGTTEFLMAAELMNEQATRDAVVTIEWEFIPSIPAGFKRAALIWLDVDGACLPRGGEVPIPDGAKAFTLEMNPPWTAQLSGDILQMASHMHDGGDELLVLRNNNVACTGKARYGEKPGYVSSGDHSGHMGGGEGGGGGHHEGHGGFSLPITKRHEDTPHVSSISSCFSNGRVEIGDKWHVKANYNLTRYGPLTLGGHAEPVMGITLMYVALDPK